MTFIEWAVSGTYRTYHQSEENKGHFLVYGDESYIVLETGSFHQPRYVVRIANGEEEFDSKHEAERFLWDNHARFNYEESWRIHGSCHMQYRSQSGITKFAVRDFDHVVTGDDWDHIKEMGAHNTITCVPQGAYPDDIEDLIDLKYITLNTERV